MGILIVAECNVNTSPFDVMNKRYLVLIVAECNVNNNDGSNDLNKATVLIVAECNVNKYLPPHSQWRSVF